MIAVFDHGGQNVFETGFGAEAAHRPGKLVDRLFVGCLKSARFVNITEIDLFFFIDDRKTRKRRGSQKNVEFPDCHTGFDFMHDRPRRHHVFDPDG